VVVAFTDLLFPDGPVDLPLVVLAGLPKHGQQHDRPVGRTPVRYPDGDVGKPEPQLPYLAIELLGPRSAQRGAPLGEHASNFIDALVIGIAEAFQPVANFGFQLEPVKFLFLTAHTGHRAGGC